MRNFDDLLNFARKSMTPRLYQRFLKDDPQDHAPSWHEYGLLGHMQSVWVVAKELTMISQVDIRRIALLHDAGKIRQFGNAVRMRRAGLEPHHAYVGHEHQSARIAAQNGMSDMDQRVIAIHHWIYLGAGATKITDYLLRDQESVKKWLLLCAADARGKGWTENQKIQKPGLEQIIIEVAGDAGLPPNSPALELAIEQLKK